MATGRDELGYPGPLVALPVFEPIVRPLQLTVAMVIE